MKIVKLILVFFIALFVALFIPIFIASKINHHSIKDELSNLKIKIQTKLLYKEEINHIKSILSDIIQDDKPSWEWRESLRDSIINKKETFYFFKVWFKEAKVSKEDIQNSYPTLIMKAEDKISFNLHYKKEKPVIRVTYYKNKKITMWFPFNNCEFEADKNLDRVIDLKDVLVD